MAYKVLFGVGYDLPRFVGIKSEVWARVMGREPPITDTQFADGTIVMNSITGDLGLVLDTECQYFSALPEPHMSRLVDVIEGDGWRDINEGEV